MASRLAQMYQELCKSESWRIDMKFIRRKSGTISEPVFVTLKYLLSVLSIVLTTTFVVVLETKK